MFYYLFAYYLFIYCLLNLLIYYLVGSYVHKSHMSRIQRTHYINLRWQLMKTFVVETCSTVNIMHYVDYIMVLM